MSDQAVFVRVLQVDDKGGSLVSAIDKFRNGVPSETARLVRPGSFCQVPGSPFAYWVDDRVRSVFARFEPFESNSRLVRQGGVTGDDDRYLRGWWEAPVLSVGGAPSRGTNGGVAGVCGAVENQVVEMVAAGVGNGEVDTDEEDLQRGERKEIVEQWGKEFKLEGLWGDEGGEVEVAGMGMEE